MMTSYGEVGLFWARRDQPGDGRLLPLAPASARNEHPAPFTAATTFSPTGAELRVTEDLMHAAQEHPTLDALNSGCAHQQRKPLMQPGPPAAAWFAARRPAGTPAAFGRPNP
jgi:hypothetical protein